MELPKQFDPHELEQRWCLRWQELKVYAWEPGRSRSETFVVDTPPPTVSGSLHVGHLFSYSQQDFIVRFHRMRGKNIFFPIGWDDNGLPTERRVQNLYNVRCEPHLHPDPNLQLERGRKGDPMPVSRKDFIALCQEVTRDDEEAFRRLWTRLGMSYDWDLEYATIDEHCRRTSQASFLELLEKGEIYQAERPVMWDVDFRTAIAQAEVADKEIAGAYYFLRFGIEGTDDHVVIATTRPELLPACVAVLAHPDDARYRKYIGRHAVTPLFHAPVPIMADPKADPEKGTGIVMVCTYGDQTDVEWQRQYDLPVRQVLDRDGRLMPVTFVAPERMDALHPFVSLNADDAEAVYREVQGKSVTQARKILLELAEARDAAGGHPKTIDRPKQDVTHTVRFFEKGERPLEWIPARQWFCRVLDHRQALIEQGRKINWTPQHMGIRYEHWVEGLNQDWCLSRQRFFGVPVPVWYKLDGEGRVIHEAPLLPARDRLPVDPMDDVPDGYTEAQRDRPGGFTGDPDVLDTWATSSLTPQIATHWVDDKERHARLFPMDIRPQAHEIIRTWAFYTIVKAWLHEGRIPWKNVLISGWVLDPDRKKMSKSQGNVITPEPIIEQFSADSVRYWSARARLGVDTAYDEQVFKVGKRLSTKLFNAAKFAVGRFAGIEKGLLTPDRITVETDRTVVAELRPLMARATESFEQFDYAQALQVTEEFFWQTFCDNYLELAKARTYDEDLTPERLSAATTLRLVLRALVRLFAPFMPFLTEEIWSWTFSDDPDMAVSVHRSPWPYIEEFAAVAPPERTETYAVITAIVDAVRKSKAEANLSMKAPVARVIATVPPELTRMTEAVRDDIVRMLHIGVFEIVAGGSASQPVSVETHLT